MTDITGQDWRERALCDGADYIDWTADDISPYELGKAREVCGFCPVKDECLADALADPSSAGVRGGTTEAQRRNIRRGRPTAACGTHAGARAHYSAGESPCQPCRDASTAYQRERRGSQPRADKVQPCGTYAGAKRHRKAGQPRCEPCLEAERAYNRAVAVRRRQQQRWAA